MLVARRIAVPVGLTRFGDRPETYSVVVKQTYDIATTPARLLPEPDRLRGDEYDERETRVYPSDFSPFKLSCDVLVVGDALEDEEGQPAHVHAAAMTKRAGCVALLGPLPPDHTDPFGQDAPTDQRLPWPPLPLQVGVVYEGRTLNAIVPGPVPEAALVYGGSFGDAVSLPLHIDGVHLDPVRATCALIFRGSFQHTGSVHRDVLLVVDVIGRLAFATIEEVEGWPRTPVEMDPSALADASLVIGDAPAAIGESEDESEREMESEKESGHECTGNRHGHGGDGEGEGEEEEEAAPDSGETNVFNRPVERPVAVPDELESLEPEGDTYSGAGSEPPAEPALAGVGTTTISMRAIGTIPPPPPPTAAALIPPMQTRPPLPTLPMEPAPGAAPARPPTRPPAAPSAPALPFMRSYGAPPPAPAPWPGSLDEGDGRRGLMVIGMHGTPLAYRPPTPVPMSGPGFDNALPFTSAVPVAPLSRPREDPHRRQDTAPPPAMREDAATQSRTEPPPAALDAPGTEPPPIMTSAAPAAPSFGTAPPPALASMPLPFIPRAAGVPTYQRQSTGAFAQAVSPSNQARAEPADSIPSGKRVEGISIEEFASVRVALWANEESSHNVLRRWGLSELRWRVVMRKWSDELATMRVKPAELASVIDHVRKAGRKAEGS